MVFERVREIICDQLDLDEDRVTMDSNLLEDFDADSLDIVDLSMTLEDEFGLEMPDEQNRRFSHRWRRCALHRRKHLSFRFAFKAPKPWGFFYPGAGGFSALPYAAELFCKENAV